MSRSTHKIATIDSFDFSVDRRSQGCGFELHLKYEGEEGSFSSIGYGMGAPPRMLNGTAFLWSLLAVCGVKSLREVIGRRVRVKLKPECKGFEQFAWEIEAIRHIKRPIRLVWK